MKLTKFLASAFITGLLFYMLNFPVVEQAPFPIGQFLNPFSGFWQNNMVDDEILSDRDLPGLRETVVVQWDDRRIPHIFARNNHDLYFAQGYLMARDRLWQMDMITRFAGGRLAEVVPERAELDRYRRRTGMLFAAENALKALEKDSVSKATTDAYTSGVNAWTNSMTEAEYPLEFKLLNYAPEPWTSLKSALLLKYMAWNLSARNKEVLRSRTRATLGDSTIYALLLDKQLKTEPIIPPGTNWDFQPENKPAAPDSLFLSQLLAFEPMLQPDPFAGSNNWVVGGSKTLSGYPILSNDPHLALNLPSIWHEMQLVSPDVNVYGVTLPGSPGIVIGFNQHIAWGVTNAGTDVMDWYQIKFHPEDPWQYRFGDEWLTAEKRIETIYVRDGETISDTIAMTRFGPVAYREGEETYTDDVSTGMALRWMAHDPSNEVLAFWKLNRAVGYNEFVAALKHYVCPAQNFVFASKQNDIAIHHHGKFPLRWENQGRFVSDGSDPRYDWQGYIPYEQIPHVKNPPQAYLASANQKPVDDSYPYLMYGHYATFERGARIHEQLAEMSDITPEDMMALQNDNMNLHARTLLPVMLDAIYIDELSIFEQRNLESLQQWNYVNHRDSIAPIIFDYWWRHFHKLVWEDEFFHPDLGRLMFPPFDKTMDLVLNDRESIHFDNISTPDYQETLGDMLLLSYQAADTELGEAFGKIGPDWRWGKSRGTDIMHLLRIPALSRMNLNTSGNRAIVNATRKYAGPSWRMVVALGPDLQAWGVYPGGQSGNPGSTHYDDFIDDWVEGQYFELIYLTSPADEHPRLTGRTTLGGAKK